MLPTYFSAEKNQNVKFEVLQFGYLSNCTVLPSLKNMNWRELPLSSTLSLQLSHAVGDQTRQEQQWRSEATVASVSFLNRGDAAAAGLEALHRIRLAEDLLRDGGSHPNEAAGATRWDQVAASAAGV